MLYLPISGSWMLSQSARRVYLVCAIANIYLLVLWFWAITERTLHGTGPLERWPRHAMTLKILFMPGILGTALLAVAMWYFWFTFDQSHWMKKALWFVGLYPGIMFVPALYHFLVYRRQSRASS